MGIYVYFDVIDYDFWVDIRCEKEFEKVFVDVILLFLIKKIKGWFWRIEMNIFYLCGLIYILNL